jgi:hypothetical protein
MELGGGATVLRQERATVDVIGGMRYFNLKGALDTPGVDGDAHMSQSENLVNGFVGVRGRIAMTQDGHWYMFYVDVGTGSSGLTWQAMTGLGYALKRAELDLTYRYLAFHGTNDQLAQTIRFSGPSLGATFRF